MKKLIARHLRAVAARLDPPPKSSCWVIHGNTVTSSNGSGITVYPH